ncbi:hypothetical protein M422DRAFT_48041 [Sphaerobolus stellatus SS14]|uniref:Uncharacterized protein n=1 Tax=Sphaerobolus stellatus (strain SS14) TaxID=990650 RepID=A0A0C9VXA6_SPHS4|nr:hypothetical protein M422DRAFT_48041 [Sphaerobolus stellatus SS14]
MPPADWWPMALRNHTAPFYFVPGTPSENAQYIESEAYYWFDRMPDLGETSSTPLSHHILGPSPMLNLISAPALSQISSQAQLPPAGLDTNLANGLSDGFQSTETCSLYDEAEVTLKNALKILHSQGRSTIDPCFMGTFNSKLMTFSNFISGIKQHEQHHSMPTTNGQDGLV